MHCRFLSCLLLLAVCSVGRFVDATPPNVVLIVSDDQGWTDYGFMGHEHIRTPHIDRLARQSLTYTRGYVPDSLCRPSLATILTGLYPHQHGIVGNDPPPPDDLLGTPRQTWRDDPRYLQRSMDYIRHIDDEVTLADLLGGMGYWSHQSGKWWEGHYRRGGFTHGMTHGDRTRGGRHGDNGLSIGREGLEAVFAFIESATRQERPFFVYYAPFMPHTPHNPPRRLLEEYTDKTPHLRIARYWAMCHWFDETVGELLDYLDRKRLAEDTIVLYVADNGWITRTDGPGYDRRSKRSQYDAGVRTPILVRWPATVAPKIDSTHCVSSIDLVPTVLAAVGLAPTPAMQGVDLLDRNAVAERDAIFGEILEHDIQDMADPVASLRFRWILEGDWKLVVPNLGREPEAKVELYDVTHDPGETNNLASERRALVRHLRTKLDTWWPAQSGQ